MMTKFKKHILKDGLKIAVLTLMSFGVFYLVLAQVNNDAVEPYSSPPPEVLTETYYPSPEITDIHYPPPKVITDTYYSPSKIPSEPYYQPPPEMKIDIYYPPENDTSSEEFVPKPLPRVDEFPEHEDSTTLAPQPGDASSFLSRECVEKGITDPNECDKIMIEMGFMPRTVEEAPLSPLAICHEKGIIDIEECKRFINSLEQGDDMRLKPEVQHIPYECQQQGIRDEFDCVKFLSGMRHERTQNEEMPLFMMPPECQEREIRDSEDCKALMDSLYGAPRFVEDHFVGGPILDFSEQLPPPCQEQNIHDPMDCAEYMKNQFVFGPEVGHDEMTEFVPGMPPPGHILEFKPEYLPYECREQGFTTPEECETYFMDKAVPLICKEQGATTPEECEAIIMKRIMPPECLKRGALTEAECDRVLSELFLPKSCEEAGAYDKASCATVIFEKHGRPIECENLDDASCFRLMEREDVGREFTDRVEREEIPLSCRELGATTFEECEELHADKLVPEECREAGIFSPRGCEKYLFEKFHSMPEERIVLSMPLKCQEAGVTDPEDCRKLMEIDLFPRECVEAGVLDPRDCHVFMELRYMPPACQKAGIRTRMECDEYLRQQFVAPICEMQGITDAHACDELVHNTIEGRVSCHGLTPEECELSVKKRHLGTIFDAAQRVDKVVRIINTVAGDAGTIDLDALAIEDEEAHRLTLEILPIKGTEMRKLSVFRSRAQIKISENDEVLAETSVVLTFDSDGDGLPDDVEKRNDLDPNSGDSDGDGVSDIDELKKIKTLAPIDIAVATGREIGQPRTEGEIDNALEVSSISSLSNVENETAESEGIALNGKGHAGEVVTIYIYSDLPLVLTTTVDENGEWKYNFEEQLSDGVHEVYVVVNNDTGKVVRKSNPLSFVVNVAKALTIKEAAAAGELEEVAGRLAELPPDVNVEERSMVSQFIRMFLLGVAAIIVIALILAVKLIRPKRPTDKSDS